MFLITMNCFRILTDEERERAYYPEEQETGRSYIGSYPMERAEAMRRHGQTFGTERSERYYWEAAYPELLG